MTSTRWIGDLSTCFLLEGGWAFRLKVNRFQLDKDRPGWQMPLSVAESLGLEIGQVLELPCEQEGICHTLYVERRDDGCVGGRIGTPLRGAGCREGDLAFIVFRADSYKVIARTKQEVDPEDPPGLLLWYCGLDPNDEALRSNPWPRLARTLGGTGTTKEAVADRLRRRGDERLLALLEQAAMHRTDAPDEWTSSWQYVLPDHDDDERFILQRSDGAVRVALGVLDGTGQPPMGLTVGDGNGIWATLMPSDGLDMVLKPLMLTPPSGLVPSARRSSWVRWMRADHAGRRAALLGRTWCIHRSDGWRTEGGEFGDLRDALLSLRPDDSGASPPPEERIRHDYPRTGMAFSRLVESAVARGLNAITGAPAEGYVARFDRGERPGVSLIDALAA